MAEVLNLKMNNIGTPGTFIDSSPSAHTITAEGDATQIETALTNRRTAFFFDGDSDWISIPDSADWDIWGDNTQDYTIDFFVKHDDHAGTEVYIMQGTASDNMWELRHDHGSGVYLKTEGNVTGTSSAGGEITDTDWHHIALAKVTSAGPTVLWGIYVDGVQVVYMSDNDEGTWAAVLGIASRYTGSDLYFDGHMKNVRISTSNVFGAAPVVGKTDTITVPTANPVSDANTKLLLLADAPAQLNSPLNSTAQFDGVLTYFTAPDSADWDFGTDEWTYECWMRTDVTSYTPQNGILITTGLVAGVALSIYEGRIYGYVVATGYDFADLTLIVDTWYHVAMVRDGNTLRTYLNGVASSTTADITAKDITGLSAGLGIGFLSGSDLKVFDGNMKEVRVSDTCRYPDGTSFTPTTTPFVSDANTLLLCHFDGVPDDTDNTNGFMTDSSSSARSLTNTDSTPCKFIEDYRNRTVVDSGNTGHHGLFKGTSKLDWITVGGNGAGKFDGTGDYLTVPDSANWDYGTGNFTMAFWVKFSTSATQALMDNGGYTSGVDLYYTVASGLVIAVANDFLNSTWAARIGEWYYVTVIRTSGTVKSFINGSEINSASMASDITGLTSGVQIGSDIDDSFYLNGGMDIAIIDKGTALYTIPFIPPTYLVGDGKAFQSIVF